MTEIPEWHEYCDLVEPDVNLLKTVLENTDSDEFRDASTYRYHSIIQKLVGHKPTQFQSKRMRTKATPSKGPSSKK